MTSHSKRERQVFCQQGVWDKTLMPCEEAHKNGHICLTSCMEGPQNHKLSSPF